MAIKEPVLTREPTVTGNHGPLIRIYAHRPFEILIEFVLVDYRYYNYQPFIIYFSCYFMFFCFVKIILSCFNS